MTNGYRRIYPQHGTNRVNSPPAPPPDPPPPEPSAATMTLQLDDIRQQMAKLDKGIASKREDTGVHKVNTEILQEALLEEYAKAARGVWKRIRNWALGVVATVAAGGGGVATWLANTERAPTVEAADVQHTVEHEAKALEAQVRENHELAETANKNVRTLGREVVRRDEARAEQLDYVTDLVLEGNPKAKRVKPPPSVMRRREKKKNDALDEEVNDIFAPKK